MALEHQDKAHNFMILSNISLQTESGIFVRGKCIIYLRCSLEFCLKPSPPQLFQMSIFMTLGFSFVSNWISNQFCIVKTWCSLSCRMFFRPSQSRCASRPASSHNPSTANSILSEDETFAPKEMIYTDSEEKKEKHRKNCECCPVSQLIVRKQRLSWIQVLNCQNCNLCLKWHKS